MSALKFDQSQHQNQTSKKYYFLHQTEAEDKLRSVRNVQYILLFSYFLRINAKALSIILTDTKISTFFCVAELKILINNKYFHVGHYFITAVYFL